MDHFRLPAVEAKEDLGFRVGWWGCGEAPPPSDRPAEGDFFLTCFLRASFSGLLPSPSILVARHWSASFTVGRGPHHRSRTAAVARHWSRTAASPGHWSRPAASCAPTPAATPAAFFTLSHRFMETPLSPLTTFRLAKEKSPGPQPFAAFLPPAGLPRPETRLRPPSASFFPFLVRSPPAQALEKPPVIFNEENPKVWTP